MQVLSASHVSLDPKLELITAGKYFNHAEKQLQGDYWVRLPRVTCANTLGILGQGCNTFHKVYNLR
jgi:hypothetical protein